jgi:hypothetical protein
MRKNKNNTDYTLSYLRFLAGFRSSAPAARAFGLTAEQAKQKRTEVDICLGRAKKELRP